MTKDEMSMVASVVNFITARYGVSTAALDSRARDWRIVWARWLAIYLLHTEMGMTYPELKMLFNRSYWGISWAVEGIRNEIATSKAREREVATVLLDFRAAVATEKEMGMSRLRQIITQRND